jgi:hypothetical protein
MCLCSRHWILAIIYLKGVRSLNWTLLTLTNLLIGNSSIVFKGKQHINCVFITNLVIIIVTNDDPFCNTGYKWYLSQGGHHSPKHKEEMHVRYRFLVLIYTSL